MKRLIVLVIVFLFVCSGTALAAPVQWASAAGGNDHWYEVVKPGPTSVGHIYWPDARDAAIGRGGYLATLTSRAEELFVYNALQIGTTWDYWFEDAARNWQGPWLGGFQTPGARWPYENWGWVTGEAWGDTDWASGEPNDAGPEQAPFFENDNEQYLQFFYNGSWEPSWNDIIWNSPVRAYVVEYDAKPVPEPATVLLLGFGLGWLVKARRMPGK